QLPQCTPTGSSSAAATEVYKGQNVAIRIKPTTQIISPRVDVPGDEMVTAHRLACGAISSMSEGHCVNSRADASGL
ncbi:hypothetical protein JQN46_27110, partial [Enterobacter hormaechei]|uniref:hypothetical protein n=1 Tax=Enterobacter hormaechei TaxID=158836 RepID=UPI00193A4EA0|nr:hypothetical protein [Enterobacter hormaechei]